MEHGALIRCYGVETNGPGVFRAVSWYSWAGLQWQKDEGEFVSTKPCNLGRAVDPCSVCGLAEWKRQVCESFGMMNARPQGSVRWRRLKRSEATQAMVMGDG